MEEQEVETSRNFLRLRRRKSKNGRWQFLVIFCFGGEGSGRIGGSLGFLFLAGAGTQSIRGIVVWVVEEVTYKFLGIFCRFSEFSAFVENTRKTINKKKHRKEVFFRFAVSPGFLFFLLGGAQIKQQSRKQAFNRKK